LHRNAYYRPRSPLGHVRTAPAVQEESDYQRSVRIPDKQPRLAPLVRLQVSQRWARHPIDPALSGPQVDCLNGEIHRARSRSVQGFLERLTLNPNRRLLGADIAFKPGPRPPRDPRIIWVPIVAIQTIPSYTRWVPSPTSCTCYRRTLARSGANSSYLYSERFWSAPRT
jgi:hypothetical protein